jgi:ATP-dependent DNA ligase
MPCRSVPNWDGCPEAAEGIVSKRKGSPYRSGRTVDWIKCKNPDSSPEKRDVEEDRGSRT